MWLISPRFDSIWFLAGLWLLPILAIGSYVDSLTKTVLISATGLFWLGHRFASMHSVYLLPQYRNLIAAEPIRLIYAPLLIMLSAVVFMFIPLGHDQAFQLRTMVTIFFAINTYHFAIQHFGVISIYQIRAKQKILPEYKELQRYICLFLGGFLVLSGQLLHGAQLVSDSWFGFLKWNDEWVAPLKACGTLAAVAMTAFWLWRESMLEVRSLPKILYILALGIQAGLAFYLPPLEFLLLWGLPHWLISFALACIMAQNHPPLEARPTGFQRLKANLKFAGNFKWTLIFLVLISVVFTPLFYTVATFEPMDLPAVYQAYQVLLNQSIFVKIMTGISFGTVYVHFVTDRAIFRFSHPPVRSISAPLVFGSR